MLFGRNFYEKEFLLLWLDKDLKKVNTKIGNYDELEEYAEKFSEDDNVIFIDLYKLEKTIKNEVENFLLNMSNNKEE